MIRSASSSRWCGLTVHLAVEQPPADVEHLVVAGHDRELVGLLAPKGAAPGHRHERRDRRRWEEVRGEAATHEENVDLLADGLAHEPLDADVGREQHAGPKQE